MQRINGPAGQGSRLSHVAIALVRDNMVPDPDVVDDEIRSVTGDQLRSLAREWWESAMVVTAAPEAAQAAGVREAALPIIPPVGIDSSVADFDQPGVGRSALQIGPDAVTYGAKRTLPFHQAVGLLAWPDGGRVLVGRDGRQLRIEPALFAGLSKAKVERLIDARIDPRLHVQLPERTKEAVPKRWNSRLVLRLSSFLLIGFSLLALVTVAIASIQAWWQVGLVLAVMALPFWIATAWVVTTARRRRAFDIRPEVF